MTEREGLRVRMEVPLVGTFQTSLAGDERPKLKEILRLQDRKEPVLAKVAGSSGDPSQDSQNPNCQIVRYAGESIMGSVICPGRIVSTMDKWGTMPVITRYALLITN
ncbi:hypothetical protein AGQ49_25910 [Salmonella enterica subsp. enterica]|nr:hypothetical protein AGQ49_25910 [Salmonella enterica subsp. enterica]